MFGGASGQLLTITKPTGGTLSAAGIRCGTRGADCTAQPAERRRDRIDPRADAGFTFAGLHRRLRARRANHHDRAAHLRRDLRQSSPAAATTPLDADADADDRAGPTGGTLEGVDILCGTKGTVCSANHPDGVPVELHPTADPGFTFMGFKGDCVPLGHTQMTGPRDLRRDVFADR